MKRIAIVLLTGLAAAGVIACERERQEVSPEGRSAEQAAAPNQPAATEGMKEPVAEQEKEPVGGDEKQEVTQLVKDAADTLRQMKADPELKQLMSQSKGVFIVPKYGRGAVGVGARGGEGVLIAHENGKWSDPVFYDIGGISVGAQFGGEGGEIAMVLMSDKALESFKGDDTFSVNAGSKLTIADYSGLAKASLGKDAGDVVFWSGTEGAFAGVSLSATDISWDDEENPAYYGKRDVNAESVLSGKVKAADGPLQEALSGI